MSKRNLFLVLFVLFGLILFFGFRCSRKDVPTQLLRRGDMVEAVYGIGTIFSNHLYQLKVAVPSTVTRIFVKEGDVVKKGSPLLVLDVPVFAPFSGTITQVNVQLGETVPLQAPILTLTDMAKRYMKVSLDQDAAVHVVPGQEVRISFESFRNQPFYGKVRSVFSHDQQFWVYVDVGHLPPVLLPGMTADVAIQIGVHRQVWQVPVAAVKSGQVRIKRNGSVISVPVKLGLIDGDIAEVVSANFLSADQLILE